ncbi:MAG: hypothetical protein DRI56_10225 [Chloroflexota bacterium]|nr:MAG: hypothetical protein B6243_03925 [Anaerolineaceae bacterium 4572_5.2]RLD05023.1 MAG: hypothetical protein DRI56_10225 [Chloroflexota bacterium]
MKLKFRAPIATAIAMAVGIVVLLGYFVPAAKPLHFLFLRIGMVLAAVTLLVGVFNLLFVHIRKMSPKDSNGVYSFILVLALLITLGVGIFDIYKSYQPGTSSFEWSNWIFTYIQLPIETSLFAVMTVSLTYAAAHLLRRKQDFLTISFFFVVLLIFLGTLSLPIIDVPVFEDIYSWIISVPALGGARGLLLGIALGTIATGLRILTGSDRPYGG